MISQSFSRAAVLGAMVCLPGVALAQSSVQLYGLVDVSVGQFDLAGGLENKAVASGNMTTSYIGFKGTEDLGGGLSARFQIESFLRADTGESGRFGGDAFWARNAFVGLSGGFGSLSVGRNTTTLFVSTLLFNPFGDSFGFSPSIRHYFAGGVGVTTGDTGWSDSLSYASPKLGGLSFTVQAAAGEGNGGRNLGGQALYFGGPFAASLAYQTVEKGATVADTRTWQAGGSYDFGLVKLFGQYGQVHNDSTDVAYKLTELGASVPVGQGKLLLAWGRQAADTDITRNTTSLGYDHSLSKRTDVYAVWMNDQLTDRATGNSVAVGVRHRF